MTSIRRRLLMSLLGLWLGVWGAVALVTQDRSAHEVDELLDAQLAQAAKVLRTLSVTDAPSAQPAGPQVLSPLGHPYESKLSYQRWQDGRLAASFGAAPTTPLAAAVGFSDQEFEGTHWRVFGLPGEGSGEVIFVAQNLAIRRELIGFLTIQALEPILWSLPLSLVLIWLAVTDGLRPLRQLARSIERRSPERLDPIDTEGVPDEIRSLTAALNDLMVRLDEAIVAERRFAADASHELRTPFAVIRTHAQIAQRSSDPVERARAIEYLIQGVDRGTRIVSQLLTLARLQGEPPGKGAGAASLPRAVAREVAERQETAAAKSMTLTADTGSADPAVVAVPGPVLGMLIGNLVENSIKYTQPGGRVVVRVSPESACLALEVIDTGPGIPTCNRQRVFDRFHRPAGQTQPGSGLGLAIVRRICDRYGLTIELRDGPGGVGLNARVQFPTPLGPKPHAPIGLKPWA